MGLKKRLKYWRYAGQLILVFWFVLAVEKVTGWQISGLVDKIDPALLMGPSVLLWFLIAWVLGINFSSIYAIEEDERTTEQSESRKTFSHSFLRINLQLIPIYLATQILLELDWSMSIYVFILIEYIVVLSLVIVDERRRLKWKRYRILAHLPVWVSLVFAGFVSWEMVFVPAVLYGAGVIAASWTYDLW